MPIESQSLNSQRVFGIAGRSGSGKTTLIESMMPTFSAAQWKVNVIKHSHHDIELDPPGKDTSRFRQAGAQEVVICSPYRYSFSRELNGEPQPTLADLVGRLSSADLTIVEGYQLENLPRIEVYRPSRGHEPQYPELQSLVAVVSDESVDAGHLPVWPLNDPEQVAKLIMKWFSTGAHR